MDSIHFSAVERQTLRGHYRRTGDPAIRLRAHVLLLLDAGHPWATIRAALFGSLSTISRWKVWEGAEAALGRPRSWVHT